MNPTIESLLQRALPHYEVAALADADVRVTLRQDGAPFVVTLGGTSSRLVHARIEDARRSLAPATRAMLCIELDGGSLRVDIPVEVVAAGRTSSVLRMLAPPLVLRRRMVRDQRLGEALGIAQPAPRDVPLVA